MVYLVEDFGCIFLHQSFFRLVVIWIFGTSSTYNSGSRYWPQSAISHYHNEKTSAHLQPTMLFAIIMRRTSQATYTHKCYLSQPTLLFAIILGRKKNTFRQSTVIFAIILGRKKKSFWQPIVISSIIIRRIPTAHSGLTNHTHQYFSLSTSMLLL